MVIHLRQMAIHDIWKAYVLFYFKFHYYQTFYYTYSKNSITIFTPKYAKTYD